MDGFIDGFENAIGLKGKKNDDFYDRLNSRYTTMVLIVFAFTAAIFQLGDNPITCWFPVHFADSHKKFANSYCWVKNTYYLPYHERIPKEDESERRQMIIYYQWVPFILLVQALLFKLPGIVWNALNSKAGLDADDIMISAAKLNNTQREDNRDAVLTILTRQLDRFLGIRGVDERSQTGSRCKHCMTALCHCCGNRFGAYLVILFHITKLLYIANILFQLFILNSVLGTRYSKYGFDVVKGMTADHDWEQSPDVAFPRVTMCDFNIRRLGNLHRYTVQCTLPLNLYNEKIYIFLWFWFVLVLICSIIGFFQWVIRSILRKDKRVFLSNHLGSMERFHKGNFNEENRLDEFINDYLKQDGIFILRLISDNTNHLSTKEIIARLWDRFLERRQDTDTTLLMKKSIDGIQSRFVTNQLGFEDPDHV